MVAYTAYVAGDDPGPTVYGNTTGSPEDDGSVHSLQTGPFYARYGATGAAGFVAWNSANGATFFDKAVMYCQEASEGKGTASGARCVFNAMNYAIGCGVAITASVYFTDHILSGAGHAMQFVNGGGAKRSLNNCDTNPERCDALSQHLVLMMPDHHDHRVAQIMRDDTEVANGHRFTLQKSGRHVAHVSVNSTHHVLKMGQDLPVGPKARRDFLPTANHYYNWQGQLAGLKVEGKNFDQPADPTSYIANLRTTISGLGNNGAYQTDSTPFTACSKYKHDKIYDGKFVFEGASFGDNFETYYTFACPDALK